MKVLIVDDEVRMAKAVAVALERVGLECTTASSGPEALALHAERGADCVVSDWRMPGMDGLQLMQALHARDPSLPVIIITAHADVPSAVDAIKKGAFDYVTKPFDNDELRAAVKRALDLTSLARENRWLRERIGGGIDVVAKSGAMRAVIELAQRVARSNATVLIQGDSGTGKEVIAKLIHHESERVGRPFVAVNCKAFAEGVLESELFGHEKGAFTGAETPRAGCFERADGGTLFLDEIGEVADPFQAKLLRVLQESEVLRVGGDQARKVDVRVVAATNKDLTGEVKAGRFREDLFFRLNVIPIGIPRLAERTEDVLPLIAHFLEKHRAESGVAKSITPEAKNALLAHPWAGNVRELENVVERAVILSRGSEIGPEDLLLSTSTAKASPEDAGGTLQDALDRATVRHIKAALERTGGKKAEAAAELGVERTTLYRLMKRLEIR